MQGKLDQIIIKQLDEVTLSNSNLYRTEIVESLFVSCESQYRKYEHREREYGSYTELISNNIYHIVYVPIKLVCDKNTLAFPFLLSNFYGKDILKEVSGDLIESLMHEPIELSLRSNTKAYLTSPQDIQERNNFLYKIYDQDKMQYKKNLSQIIENKLEDYISQLQHEEVQEIYNNISDKVKSFDNHSNKKFFFGCVIAMGFIYGGISSIYFISRDNLRKEIGSKQAFEITIIPFLAIVMLGGLLYSRQQLYNISDEFKDLGCPSRRLNKAFVKDEAGSSKQYGTIN